MFTQKFIKIFHSVQEIWPFSLFRILQSAKPRPMINVILQFLGLDLFNIKLSAKFYQNVPNSLMVNFHFLQNLNLGKTSTNPKCHLIISLTTSCQYTNVYAKFHHNIPLSSRDRAIFTFQNFAIGKASTDDKCHFAIPWVRSFQYQIVCKILSECSKQFNG